MAGHCPIFYQDPLRPSWTTEVAGRPYDAQLPCPLVAAGENAAGRILDDLADAVGIPAERCPRGPLLLLYDVPKIVALAWRETIVALEYRTTPGDAGETSACLLHGIRIEAGAGGVPEDRGKLNS
jgi:hypothetical protein